MNLWLKNASKPMACVALTAALSLGCAGSAYADAEHDAVASRGDSAKAKEVSKYGMVPISGQSLNDGTYSIQVATSSKFFRVSDAKLTVKKGEMKAKVTLSSSSYELIYLGTAQEAAEAPSRDYIRFDGTGESFEMDVEALDAPIACAAYSKRKHKWYDRDILFDASTLPAGALTFELPDYDYIEQAVSQYESPEGSDASQAASADSSSNDEPLIENEQDAAEAADIEGIKGEGKEVYDPTANVPVAFDKEDGTYSIEVNMIGGSGRASVSSPTWFIVKDGKAYARLLWSSSHYDYMIVGGEKYLNESDDGGNSTFTIPISVMDEPIKVIADTTAMGDPVEIEYTLTFYSETVADKGQIPQEAAMQVLAMGGILILLGGILNFVTKRAKRRKSNKRKSR